MSNVTIYDSDESLADELQQANKEALNILYDRYAAALFGVLQKITGNTDIAEEAFQVCFLNIWQNKNSYNSSKEKLPAWMFRLAREAAEQAIHKRNVLPANQSADLLVSVDNSPYNCMENVTLIIELLISGGISQKKAAEKMGVTILELRQMVRKEINKLRGVK